MKNKSYHIVALCMLFSFVLLNACSSSKSIKKIRNFDDNKKINVSLKSIKTLSKAHQEKFNHAKHLMDSFLNSKEFKALVIDGPDSLNYIDPNEVQTRHCNQQGRSTFTYNTVNGKCFNNKEIYRVIKSAKWQLNVSVKPYSGVFNCDNPWSNAIGALEGETIVTSECKFNTMPVELLSGFLIHEYLHVIGFRHPYQSSPNRKNTVPYFIGDNAIEAFNARRKNSL